jgi:hypothetical protein
LTRTQLELGGKNALIVMADADLDATLTRPSPPGSRNAGQVVHVDEPDSAAAADRRTVCGATRCTVRKMTVGAGV